MEGSSGCQLGISSAYQCCTERLGCRAVQLQRQPDVLESRRSVASALSAAGGVTVGCALIMAGFASAQSLAWFGPAFAGGEFGL
jgi:hypothetical protein